MQAVTPSSRGNSIVSRTNTSGVSTLRSSSVDKEISDSRAASASEQKPQSPVANSSASIQKPSLWQKFLSLFSKKAKTPEQQVTAMQVKKVSDFVALIKRVDLDLAKAQKRRGNTDQLSGELNRLRGAIYLVDQLSINFDGKQHSLANFACSVSPQLLKERPAELAHAIESFEQQRRTVMAQGDNPYTLLDQSLGVNPD